MPLLSQSVQHEPAFHQIYAAIESQVVNDDLPFSDTLPALKTAFGLSYTEQQFSEHLAGSTISRQCQSAI